MCGPLKLTAYRIWDLETNSSHKMFGDRIEEVEEEWGRSSPTLIPYNLLSTVSRMRTACPLSLPLGFSSSTKSDV